MRNSVVREDLCDGKGNLLERHQDVYHDSGCIPCVNPGTGTHFIFHEGKIQARQCLSCKPISGKKIRTCYPVGNEVEKNYAWHQHIGITDFNSIVKKSWNGVYAAFG